MKVKGQHHHSLLKTGSDCSALPVEPVWNSYWCTYLDPVGLHTWPSSAGLLAPEAGDWKVFVSLVPRSNQSPCGHMTLQLMMCLSCELTVVNQVAHVFLCWSAECWCWCRNSCITVIFHVVRICAHYHQSAVSSIIVTGKLILRPPHYK